MRWMGVLLGAVVVALSALAASPVGAQPSSTRCGEVEGFEVRAEGARTRCGFARATMKKVRHLALHSGGHAISRHFTLRVRHRKLSCHNFYVGRAQTIRCKGRQRRVTLQYTFP